MTCEVARICRFDREEFKKGPTISQSFITAFITTSCRENPRYQCSIRIMMKYDGSILKTKFDNVSQLAAIHTNPVTKRATVASLCLTASQITGLRLTDTQASLRLIDRDLFLWLHRLGIVWFVILVISLNGLVNLRGQKRHMSSEGVYVILLRCVRKALRPEMHPTYMRSSCGATHHVHLAIAKAMICRRGAVHRSCLLA